MFWILPHIACLECYGPRRDRNIEATVTRGTAPAVAEPARGTNDKALGGLLTRANFMSPGVAPGRTKQAFMLPCTITRKLHPGIERLQGMSLPWRFNCARGVYVPGAYLCPGRNRT